uniref:Adenylosuccinate synthetase n=1 Tax=Mesocestoides corti TaxID=53468 RepID=A0A5K3EQI6_MESCO
MNCDVVCRCQGGSNAGHTVITNGTQYYFRLIPCGILKTDTMCIIGNGVVISFTDFFNEMDILIKQGIPDIEGRVRISENAHIVFDIH